MYTHIYPPMAGAMGSLKDSWTPPEIRDEFLDYIDAMTEKTGLNKLKLIEYSGISTSKYYHWQQNRGKPLSPKRDTPRSHQLLPTEVDAIVEYKKKHLELGYRRLAWMMVDEDVVYASPASVHRVYVRNGLNTKFTRDGGTKHPTGFEQPESAHEQWHIDIAYINVFSTFMFLITILDGFSRFIVSWRLFRTMRSLDVEIVLQRAFENFSGVNPRVITDNGSQFLSKDFKSMLKHFGIEHSKSRVNHPQSNGKIE